MLLSLCLSLTGLISNSVQPLANPGPAEPMGPVQVSLIGLDVRTDFLAQGWPLPSQLSVLLASAQPSSESGHPLTEALSLLASQDDDSCALNGNEKVQFIIGEPGEPTSQTYPLPFVCPNGVTIIRQVTHKVTLRKNIIRTTKFRSSPIPGVVCPPLVTNQEYNDIASEEWAYDPLSGCSGECCLLMNVIISKEYNKAMTYLASTNSTVSPITCPDGSKGIKTTTVETYKVPWRSVTDTVYNWLCTDVPCPGGKTEGPWQDVFAKSITTVTTNCKPQTPLSAF
jgi:hypothetical protein